MAQCKQEFPAGLGVHYCIRDAGHDGPHETVGNVFHPASSASSAPRTPTLDELLEQEVEGLALVARRAQREWWSTPGEVTEGQKWVFIVRAVVSDFIKSTKRSGRAEDVTNGEKA